MFKTRNNCITIAMLIAATVIISLALPRHDKITQLSYESGKPWLNPMLTAPFDIPIERDEADIIHIDGDPIMATETLKIDCIERGLKVLVKPRF